VQGRVSWTETDTISPSNNSKQLTWNDPFNGAFSQILNAGPAPSSYCPPCYTTAQGISNAQVTVKAVAGSCPADSSLNTGNPISYGASNVVLH
jgi:hypothetical protein